MGWRQRKGTVAFGVFGLAVLLTLEVALVRGSPGGYVEHAGGALIFNLLGIVVFRAAVWPAIRVSEEAVHLRNLVVDRVISGSEVEVRVANGSLVLIAGKRTIGVFAFGGSLIGALRGNPSSSRVEVAFAQNYRGAGPVVIRSSCGPLLWQLSAGFVLALCAGLVG